MKGPVTATCQREVQRVRAPKRGAADGQSRLLREALASAAIKLALPCAPQVLERLRSAIIWLRLLPGAPLSEAVVASVLGISRTPVREALRDLSVIGLIDIFPQAATVVAPIRMSLIQQEIFVREALEGTNLFDVMHQLDAEGRKRIQTKQHIDRARLLVTRDNLALCQRADKEHLRIKRALFKGDEALLRKALHGHGQGLAQAVFEFTGRAESALFVD